MKKYVVGITGASGVIIGIRIIEELTFRRFKVMGIITASAAKVIAHELGASFQLPLEAEYFEVNDASAPLNSSSFLVDGMIIAPCSMKTLAAVAHGYGDNLLVRAAENQLRTGRTLIVAPRETPLALSHLTNLVQLKQAGAIICPPIAAYYHRPQSVDDMTNFFVGKILDLLQIPNDLYQRWEKFS